MSYYVQIDDPEVNTTEPKFKINSSTSYVKSLNNLIDMGFEENKAELAIHYSNDPNDIETVLSFLLKSGDLWNHVFVNNPNNSLSLCLVCGDPINHHGNEEISIVRNVSSNEPNLNSPKRKQNELSNEKLEECLICTDVKTPSKFIQFSCEHQFCSDCFTEYIQCQFQEGKILEINCMMANCSKIISDFEIESKINDKALGNKVVRLRAIMKLNSNPNIIWCSEPKCSKYTQIQDKHRSQGWVKCECGVQLCVLCKRKNHPKTFFSLKDCETQIEKDYEIWARGKNVQLCPKCNFRVEKDDGCNHMTCSICMYEWCWLCRQKYSRTHYNYANFLGCPGLGGSDQTKIKWPLWKIVLKRTLAFFILMLEIFIVVLGFPFFIGSILTIRMFVLPFNQKCENILAARYINTCITTLLRFWIYIFFAIIALSVFAFSMSVALVPTTVGIAFSTKFRTFIFSNIQSSKRIRSRSNDTPTKKDHAPKLEQTVGLIENDELKEKILPKSAEPKSPEQKILDTDLINSLKEEPSYLAQKYNKIQKAAPEEIKINSEPANLTLKKIGRTGGVYVPPHKLAQLQEEILANESKNSRTHQKLMWEMLRKSINGIINKVNIANIQNVIIELLNENILQGRGLVARAIIKGQMSSPGFTHVYAALLCVLNSKLPEIGLLVVKRVILQFQRAFKRNNKIVCMATAKFMAHMINQQIISDYLGLQILFLFLENPTEDSVDMACDFMIECGQVLSEVCPTGVSAIFERFKGILHEGETDQRAQYSIEHLFAIRKSKFADHQGIIPELDLMEEEDKIIHNIDLEDELDGEDLLNIFNFDPNYEKSESEWEKIKNEILGEDNVIKLKTAPKDLELEEEEEEEVEEGIEDLTDKDLINLRRTIYLAIMNSVDFEECGHKLIKMNLVTKYPNIVSEMLMDCCMHERTYLRFYGLLGQRFCQLYEDFQILMADQFKDKYTSIHRFDTNKLRNCAKFFAHLLFSDALEWNILECIVLKKETTTSSSRIFIKVLFQEMAENLGMDRLQKRLSQEELKPYLMGIFPKDHPRNVRFSINFFTSIGLGGITEDSREYLAKLPEMILNSQMLQQKLDNSSSSDSDSDGSSDSDSDSSDSDSD